MTCMRSAIAGNGSVENSEPSTGTTIVRNIDNLPSECDPGGEGVALRSGLASYCAPTSRGLIGVVREVSAADRFFTSNASTICTTP